MALDRWIALVLLMICLAYGYAAFFTMDATLPPFMKLIPVWPSTFPKVLSVMAVTCAVIILLGLEKGAQEPKPADINYRRLTEYKLGQAIALLLRPAGFLVSTVGFLTVGGLILGERKLQYLIPVAVLAAGLVWYLVQQVLGIYLRPWPFFILGAGG